MYALYMHSNALGVHWNCASSFYWHDRWSNAYPCQKVFPVELHISAAGKKVFGRSGRVSYSIRLLTMKITVNHIQSVTRVTKNPAQWTCIPLKVNLYSMAQRSWGSQADLIWFVFRLSLHHQGIGSPPPRPASQSLCYFRLFGPTQRCWEKQGIAFSAYLPARPSDSTKILKENKRA